VRDLLDDLAFLVVDVTDEDPARLVLAAVVADLERLADAELGGNDDVLPVLQRRFARAHRLLLRAGTLPDDVDGHLERAAALLRDPFAALPAACQGWHDLGRVHAS
jgi:hypothetical protein